MSSIRRPEANEAPAWMAGYIAQVEGNDPRPILQAQVAEALDLFRGVSEQQSLGRYAADKWSLREALGHINDTERVFAFRALWFARELGPELPGFDQEIGVRASGAEALSWAQHVAEFEAVRAASIALFGHLPQEAWDRGGRTGGHPVTVRALAFVTAGHLAHHLRILREKYL